MNRSPNPANHARTISFVVSDAQVSSVPATRLLNRVVVNQAPVVINPLPEQQIQVGTPFNFTLAADSFFDAENETLSLSAEQTDGQALPSWVSFDAKTQRFNGTALTAGVANFTVTAQDSHGAGAHMPVNIAIAPQPARESQSKNALSRNAKIGIGVGVGAGAAGLSLVGLAAGALGFGLFACLRKKSLQVVLPQKTDTKDIELGEVKAERGTDI